MKDSNIYLDINKVRSQIGMLRQQKSLLKNDRQRLEQLRGELRWEGKARDTYIRKQDDMIDDLNQIERRLDDLIDTIENTAKAIRKTDEELKLTPHYALLFCWVGIVLLEHIQYMQNVSPNHHHYKNFL